MTVKAVYHRTSFQVTISKDDIYDLIEKGGAEVDFYLGKRLVHPGAVMLVISSPVRDDLAYLVVQERETYDRLHPKGKGGKRVTVPEEDPGEEVDYGKRA